MLSHDMSLYRKTVEEKCIGEIPLKHQVATPDVPTVFKIPTSAMTLTLSNLGLSPNNLILH